MPSYRDSLPEEDRWALSYYVLALSAYKDPLSLQPLNVSDADRAALNDLARQADTPAEAYVPGGGSAQKTSQREGESGSAAAEHRTAQGE